MIVLSGALVLVALVLLVFGAVDRNLPYVYASIGVSLLSLLLLLVGIVQRRGELGGEEQDAATTPVTDTSDERVPALAGAVQEEPAAAQVAAGAPAVAAPASRRVVPAAAPVGAPAEPQDEEPEAFEDEAEDDLEDDLEDEVEDGDVEDDEEPVGSGVTVLVVSGRPRYHLEGCRVLRGKEPQPLDRDDARTHGFSPCGVCKPDADETDAAEAAQQPDPEEEQSFTETLFGGPLFADSPPADRPPSGAEPDRTPAAAEQPVADRPVERVETSALPDRPVQPVLTDVDAAPQDDAPLAELHGDDPADDATLEERVAPAAPAPDVVADPDEPFAAPDEAAPPAEADVPVALDDTVRTTGAESPVVTHHAVTHDALPTADELVLTGAPVVDSAVSAEDADAPVADDVPLVEAPPVEPAAARSRTSSRKASSRTTAAATAADEAEVLDAGAGEAPAKAAKAPAKKAPAKKTPAKTAAKSAPAKTAAAKSAAKAPAKSPGKAAVAPPVEAPAAPKRPLVRAVRADALRLGSPSAGSTTTRVAARAAAPASAPPVVVVPDRDRFHRPECRFVRGAAGATTLPKASATRQGYAPCGVCKP